VGTHDFSSFCAAGSSVKHTTRTIYFAEVSQNGPEVTFKVCADGFLYNMVRIIVGTLFEINCGRIPPGGIPRILNGKNRSLAGFTAPPHGLYLYKVNYGDDQIEREESGR
jgi:tRNA pseudouridine38-40 synthase